MRAEEIAAAVAQLAHDSVDEDEIDAALATAAAAGAFIASEGSPTA
jgi:hypothetical protein